MKREEQWEKIIAENVHAESAVLLRFHMDVPELNEGCLF